MQHVTGMSSDVPTADASHLTGSVIMTTTVETILMSKDVVSVKVILRLVRDLQVTASHLTHIVISKCKTAPTLYRKRLKTQLFCYSPHYSIKKWSFFENALQTKGI